MRWQFLDHYEPLFASTPVTVQEFHAPHWDQRPDLKQMIEIAKASNLLRGFAFFEFEVRYDKGGTEMDFGMFGLGNYSLSSFDYFGWDFESWCLVPHKHCDYLLPDAVADAF